MNRHRIEESGKPRALAYAGLFLLALSTLMFEILLTRIFSVTMYYHFAFVAVSVAMFGMTVGAVIVHALPALFPTARVVSRIAASGILFAITSVASLALHLMLPGMSAGRVEGLAALAPTYLLLTVPFTFSGIAICLTLTRHPRHVGPLYAADLCGAALGCVALIPALRVTDGPTAAIIAALLGAIGSVLFAVGSRSAWTRCHWGDAPSRPVIGSRAADPWPWSCGCDHPSAMVSRAYWISVAY